MAIVETKDGTRIYFNDWGRGQPVVFRHGWPLSADAFEDQMFYLATRGYRRGHDRRIVRGAKLNKGAPHGMCTTHKNEVNEDLIAFTRS